MEKKELSLELLLPDGTKETLQTEAGTTLLKLAGSCQDKFSHRILGAVVNGSLCDLNTAVGSDGTVEFITMANRDGYMFYFRSIFFVLVKAAAEILPNTILRIEYSLGNGYFCWFEGLEWLDADEVFKIAQRMEEIISYDLPFVRQKVDTCEAIELFRKNDLFDKVSLFKNRTQKQTNVYSLGNTVDYFFGYLVPSTSYCDKFRLQPYQNGMVLIIPQPSNPDLVPQFHDSPKYFNIIQEHDAWLKVLEMSTCAQLNDLVRNGKSKDIILLCEALHAKKLAKIADDIYRKHKIVKIVSIAGPSSSGKTTTANRLCIQLRVNGLKPYLISLDDYFIDRDKTPLDADGNHDFESLQAIDIDLFNQNLNDLLAGHEVSLPRYDFKQGVSVRNARKLILPENGVLVIEGIHGLNPNLYCNVPNYNIYRIYVSALTALNIDNHNRVPTTDGRLIRRMVRDYQYRGHDPLETLRRWPSVRRGEEANIFPYQENANVMFNSTLVYEFGVMKKYVVPLLNKVSESEPEYREVKRILKLLSFFEEIDESTIPPNSIFREFIGGSVFYE